MFNKNFLRLSVLIFIIPVFLFAQEITKENGRYIANIVKTFTVGSGGRLVLQSSLADVTVQSWEKETVEIREKLRLNVFTETEAREIVERSRTGFSLTGNTIRVEGEDGVHRAQRRYVIYLPQKFDVEIRVSNGNISAKALNGLVSLRTSNGDVMISGAAGEIEVKTSAGDLQLEDISGPLDAKTSGGDVRLRNLKDNAEIKTSGGSIRLTGAAKNVELKTSGGEIRVWNVGGNLSAHTAGGSIEVKNCSGGADLKTSGGDIEIADMGNAVDAHTSGGDISGKNLAGPVSAHTSGGDIELQNVRGAAEASTAAGDVDVEITLKDFKKDHRIRLETTSGTIRLTLPPDIPASITAEIRDAGSRWKRYDIYSDFPLSSESEGGWRGIRKKGDINGGGDEILLETSSGDIYIRKGK
jgi:DUF4097 and DUF4098 domain-containing protein YvlB